MIIHEGKTGNSMFLIGRGVVRISRREDDREKDLATLFAGDFFGEMALLHKVPRTATCRAVTPCALYELRKESFDKVKLICPALREAVETTDRVRRNEKP